MSNDSLHAIYLELEGKNQDTFARLRDALVTKIRDVVTTVSENISPSDSQESAEARKQMSEDLLHLLTSHAQARLEKPSLENTKLRMEIIEKCQEIEKKFRQTEYDDKLKLLEVEGARERNIALALQNLETILRLMNAFGPLLMANDEKRTVLYCGPEPATLVSSADERAGD